MVSFLCGLVAIEGVGVGRILVAVVDDDGGPGSEECVRELICIGFFVSHCLLHCYYVGW